MAAKTKTVEEVAVANVNARSHAGTLNKTEYKFCNLKNVKEISNVKNAERILNIRTELENYKDVSLDTNFIETNEISKMYIVDGEEFSKDKKGVWLDSYLAKNLDLKVGDEIKLMATNKIYTVAEVGYFVPGSYMPTQEIKAGEVGYIAASIKSLSDIHVGDTVTLNDNPADKPLKGYKKVTPMVYCGLYPIDGSEYENLKVALEKLQLNDAALEYEPETSAALGFGFRCGFLGLLHMEIVEERIEREFNIELIATSPSVIYEVELTNGEILSIDSPSKMPEQSKIKCVKEPFVKTDIFVPNEYVGPVMELCQDKRGIYKSVNYIDEKRVDVIYELPLSEIVYDFFNKLKSFTKGYASFDYEFIGNRESKLVKLDILLNGVVVDALSVIVHKDNAYNRGKTVVENLKKIIPRQMFSVPIQASIGTRVIARETISAMKKDVLAKCYGGDVSRKRKLLEKQKEGKKRMKQVGSVEVPQEAFLSVLKLDDEK